MIQTYPLASLRNFKLCENLDVCLSRLLREPKLAVAISYEHAQNSHLILSTDIYCFERSEIIYDYALKFLVRKDFGHLHQLNAFIKAASSSGLIEKWRLDNRIKSQVENGKTSYFKTMNMDELQGYFVVCAIMVTVNFVVFLLEKYIHNKVREPNHSRLWNIVEMIINPDRHFLKETIFLHD